MWKSLIRWSISIHSRKRLRRKWPSMWCASALNFWRTRYNSKWQSKVTELVLSSRRTWNKPSSPSTSRTSPTAWTPANRVHKKTKAKQNWCKASLLSSSRIVHSRQWTLSFSEKSFNLRSFKLITRYI